MYRYCGSMVACLAGLVILGGASILRAADAPPRLTPRNRFPGMVHEYYVEQLREIERREKAQRESERDDAPLGSGVAVAPGETSFAGSAARRWMS